MVGLSPVPRGSYAPPYADEPPAASPILSGAAAAPAPQIPTPSFGGNAQYNAETKRVFVNGLEFDEADHRSALASEEYYNAPPNADTPKGTGWTPLSANQFSRYIGRIKDPSMGRIISKNFGIGVDNLQLLGGYGLQLAGAEETGAAVVKQQVKDLSYNEPYQRVFTDIESAGGALEWFIANLAQQGPNLIESALSAIAGAAVGGFVGGGANPFTAIGGAMMALGGKEGVKKTAILAAQKYARGEAIDGTEKKLLRELASGAVAQQMRAGGGKAAAIRGNRLTLGGKEALKRGKTQGRAGGAAAATFGSNYAIGASDVYGEQADAGTQNRAAALGLAIPYALAESLPEMLGLGFFVKGNKAAAKGAKELTRGKRLLQRGKRALGGGAIGIAGEGGTEAFQEALLLSQNPDVDITSKEGIHRLINSFAAGAGVSGALGTVGGAVRKTRDLESDSVDILNPPSDLGVFNEEGQGELFRGDLGTEPFDLVAGQPERDFRTEEQLELDLGPEQTEFDLPPGNAVAEGGVMPSATSIPSAQAEIVAPVAPAAEPIVDTETQEFLAAQTIPAHTPLSEAMQELQFRQAEEAQNEQFLREAEGVAAAREQEMQFREAAPAQAELPLTERPMEQPPADFPAATTPLSAVIPGVTPIESGFQGAYQGEMIDVPHRVTETGQIVMYTAPVRVVLQDSQQGIDALQALKKCLASV